MEQVLIDRYLKKEMELVENYQKSYDESQNGYCDYSHKDFFKILGETLDFQIHYFDLDLDYTGDYLVLVLYKNKWYACRYGYGSCSGCDSIYACENGKQLCECAKYIIEQLKEIPLSLAVDWLVGR